MTHPCPRPLARFVYVIGPAEGLQKVGIATDPHARLATLRTASPLELIVHAAIPVPFRAAHAVEQRAHKLLARYRVRNEWFETTPAEAVAAVQSAAEPVMGKVTAAPDPAAIWPPASQWRISPVPQTPLQSELGLPLFEFRRPAPSMPEFGSDTPIGSLGSYRLEVQCCGPVATFRLDQLAQTTPLGGRTPLAIAITRFRCERCRQPVREALLVYESAGSATARTAWRIEATPPSRRSA